MAEVSIVIPVYNAEAYVEKCLSSLLRQTFTDIEIIVVNDGSTDSSEELVRKFAVKDERIHLISQENAGVAAARNAGIELAAGRFLTFIDGDDWVKKDYIERLYLKAVQTDADMVICGLDYVTPEGKVLKRLIPGAYIKGSREEWVCRISATCCHFYKKAVWDRYQVRYISDGRGEDVPISLFFGAVCEKIETIPYAGYEYVQHEASAMHNFKGLKTISLPYRSLEETIGKIHSVGVKNSKDFHELFLLRILCTFLFQLSVGASWEKKKELWHYIRHILYTYYPDFRHNPLTSLRSELDFPFAEKVAVKLLIIMATVIRIG